MRYTRPHLSPELRAQITPNKRRDIKYYSGGVFFLALSAALAWNMVFSKAGQDNNKQDLAQLQSAAAGSKQVLGAQAAETVEQQQFTVYSVKNGDTLFNISQQYSIRWDLIADLNNLSEPYLLHPGQTLKIPQA